MAGRVANAGPLGKALNLTGSTMFASTLHRDGKEL